MNYLLSALFALSFSVVAVEDIQFEKEWIKVGHLELEVELALTTEQRARGLMYRDKVENGMLFIYDEERILSFWMLNTKVPLDIAYIKADWTIEPIQFLYPYDKKGKKSQGPAIGALEMPQGWFKAQGLAAGTKIIRCGKKCD
ncbi:DUF192 domain-containing protein [Rheinheimera soli]|jgi:uncharacterized membrane protein (UPF0127 family)|uniref:Uncharacterized membrane protein (UPF0127 family) n=1 Tax=Rheinheimera soli TaxID=443616 RepID=A0ABU1VX45_9GAMM|nr:DUF192 domain-containing protein [Rheinheimera soli]MDR7119963.1 uncharacterized membrane protein (UPF0127 family) [Rheinheimera soli]